MSPAPPEQTPALLLIGAMGTGQSDTAYHDSSRLHRAGIAASHLDLDDIGMCHPSPEGDPDNFIVTSQVLGAAWRVFQAKAAVPGLLW